MSNETSKNINAAVPEEISDKILEEVTGGLETETSPEDLRKYVDLIVKTDPKGLIRENKGSQNLAELEKALKEQPTVVGKAIDDDENGLLKMMR